MDEQAARRAAMTRRLAEKPPTAPQAPFNGDAYAAGLYAGFHKHMAILAERKSLDKLSTSCKDASSTPAESKPADLFGV